MRRLVWLLVPLELLVLVLVDIRFMERRASMAREDQRLMTESYRKCIDRIVETP